MDWTKQPLDGPTATQIAEVAAEKDDTIRTLVVGELDHAIISWASRRRTWQYWCRDDDAVWRLIHSFSSATEAKLAAAERHSEHLALHRVRAMDPDTKLRVTAEWSTPYHGSGPFSVLCSGPYTAEEIAAVFKRIGCQVRTQVA